MGVSRSSSSSSSLCFDVVGSGSSTLLFGFDNYILSCCWVISDHRSCVDYTTCPQRIIHKLIIEDNLGWI